MEKCCVFVGLLLGCGTCCSWNFWSKLEREATLKIEPDVKGGVEMVKVVGPLQKLNLQAVYLDLHIYKLFAFLLFFRWKGTHVSTLTHIVLIYIHSHESRMF